MALGIACALAHELVAGGVAAAAPPQWFLTLESGSEYDTNIHRFEGYGDAEAAAEIRAAPLLRGAVRLATSWRPHPEHRVFLSGYGGARLYASEPGQDENATVGFATGGYQWQLPRRDAVLGVHASFYDRSRYQLWTMDEPSVRQQNYAIISGTLSLAVIGTDGHQFTLLGGYRDFRYKPDDRNDWRGDSYRARYRATIWLGGDAGTSYADEASLDLHLDYGIERRQYGDRAVRDCDPPMGCAIAQARIDIQHTASAEIVYTGNRVYNARYEAQVTDSNSYGQSVARHRFEVGMTTELVADIFATARAALQLNGAYVLVPSDTGADLLTIDDENRSVLSLHLTRDVSANWSVEGRYALYTNVSGAPYLRQLFYLGAVYQYQP